jgi:hypothetical protein
MCRAYVQAIAARCGMSLGTPHPDYGTDVTLNEIALSGNRRCETGFKVDVQAKSTTRAKVGETHLRYDLEVKAHEYLRDARAWCPRILVVLLLPDEEEQWSSQTEEELVLRYCAYWLSLRGRRPAGRRKTVRIVIPRANVFSAAALQTLVDRFKRGEEP